MPSQGLFLQILKEYLHNQSTELPSSFNLEELLCIANKHQVSGIVYHQCKNALHCLESDKSVVDEFSRQYSSALFYYSNRMGVYQSLKQIFIDNEISFFSVKGFCVADLYPIPQLRTMGDVDIVMSDADRMKAHDLLLKMGFSNTVHGDREWVYFKNGMEFELHNHLLYEATVNNEMLLDFANSCWKHVSKDEEGVCRLEWEYHFIFLLLHLRKHFMNQGVGIRQFMDIAVVIQQKGTAMDWQYIENTLSSIEMLDFAKTCFAFVEKWFGIKAQLDYLPLKDEFYQKSTEKIINDGIFGFGNDENKISSLSNEMRFKDETYLFYMLRNVRQWFFPSYSSMRSVPQYAFLNGRPFLLPIAWIYRIWYVWNNKKNYSKAVLQESFASKGRLDERDKMLSEWGL